MLCSPQAKRIGAQELFLLILFADVRRTVEVKVASLGMSRQKRLIETLLSGSASHKVQGMDVFLVNCAARSAAGFARRRRKRIGSRAIFADFLRFFTAPVQPQWLTTS